MKHLFGIVIVLLLLSLGGNWIQYRSAELAQRDRNLEAKEFRNKAKESLSQIEARDAQISTLLNDRAKDSVRHAKQESVFISRISGLKSKLAPSSNRLPVIQDTIIQIQDSLITVIMNSRDTLYIQDNQVIDTLKKSNLELSELFKTQLKQTLRAENELRREKKKRWSIGPHGGYGFRGADVGFSVQYSLLKF